MTTGVKTIQGRGFRYEASERDALLAALYALLPPTSYALDEGENLCTLHDSYVGMIELPGRAIEITPRFPEIGLAQVQIMYFFVNSDSIDPTDYREVFDLSEGSISRRLAKRFIRELGDVIQSGLPHLYVYKRGDSEFLKGRLNLVLSRRNISLHKNRPFHIEYEEVNMENPISKILGAALYKVEDLVPDDFIEYARYVPFCTVEEGRKLSDSMSGRGREYNYSSVLNWARLVLYDLEVLSLGRDGFGSSFLVNLDDLFQRFCFVALKRLGADKGLNVNALAQTPTVFYEEATAHTGTQKSFQPDMVYKFDRDTGLAEAVLDCKCKGTPFHSADVYQCQFYATCLLARKCVLLYPRVGQATSISKLRIKSEFKSVFLKEMYAAYVSISGRNYQEFLSDINDFAQTVADIILD